jgi:hypothetical protein
MVSMCIIQMTGINKRGLEINDYRFMRVNFKRYDLFTYCHYSDSHVSLIGLDLFGSSVFFLFWVFEFACRFFVYVGVSVCI